MEEKKTAVIYARVSSVGDRQNTDRQVKELTDYAAYQKLEVRKVFEEHISGAKKNDERPVLCEAIDYCKEHRIFISTFITKLRMIFVRKTTNNVKYA